jgi:hypothetical protein
MSVVAEWSDVEANFAQHYHLSLTEMFSMSWRRFKVLFKGVFNWKEDEELPSGQGVIASTVDWESARENRPPVPGLLEGFQGTQLRVGKEE